MYAVIKTGGKQYRVAERDVINIEKLDTEVGSEVEFDVLAVGQGAGLKIGAPLVEGAKVTGKVLRQDRGKKVIVYKFKRRKKYRRKNGHRQSYTQVQITSIAG